MDNKNKNNTQKKLCLRRRNNDSSNTNVKTEIKEIVTENFTSKQENLNTQKLVCSEIDNKDDSLSKTEDDSIKEFKSPIKEPISKLNKFKIQIDKPKKKISVRNKTKKSSNIINQPSIESSFFTSNQDDVIASTPCPVCLKPFKDERSCTNHMKLCAAKNKVSIKQLLDAKELQNRQAEERKAMGLLAAPVIPERKKGIAKPKKNNLENDPQLQLVLAMSESLYEAEQLEFEEAALLAGIPEPCIKEITTEERRKTLTSFGFTTNKPASEATTNRTRKKKLLGPTILQTRLKEEKDRVLTERIACILTGDDALTQVENISDSKKSNTTTFLKNQNLIEIQKMNNNLWEQTRLTKAKINFYVDNLKNHFLFNDKQGFNNPELNDDGNSQNINEDLNATIRSETYEPLEIHTEENQLSENNSMNVSLTKEKNENFEYNFFKKLISNWRDALNDSAASDLIIYTKNSEIIYTHKLIFQVQCSDVLNDIEINNSDKEIKFAENISWLKFDKLSALAFLEFLYCGSISKYVNVFNDDNYLSQVRELARLYKVKDLFSYLRKKQNELFLNKIETSDDKNNDFKSNYSNKNDEVQVLEKSHSLPMETENSIMSFKKCNSDTALITDAFLNPNNFSALDNRRFTVSPDLFEAEDSGILLSNTQKSRNINEVSENNTQLAILVNLIEEDSKYIQNDKNSQKIELDTDNVQITSLKDNSFEKNSDNNSTELTSNSDSAADSIETKTNNVNKPKSETSLFIEKIQRENQRSLLESDSDIENPTPIKKKPRNPFLKNIYESTHVSSRNKIEKYGVSLLNDIFKLEETKKEENIKNTQDDSIKDLNLSEFQDTEVTENYQINKLNEIESDDKNDYYNLDSENESLQNDTCNETEISMYSKYKKNNENNSIEKYRKLLNLNSETIKQKLIFKSNDEVSQKSDNADITLVSDSDDETNFIGNKTQNNFKKDDSPIKPTDPVIELSDLSNDSNIFPNLNLTQIEGNRELLSSTSINLSKKVLTQEIITNIPPEKDNAEEKIEDEDDIGKMLRLSQEFSEEISELLDGCKKTSFSQSPLKASANRSISINLSPISICSSPDLDKNNSQELSKNNDIVNDFESKDPDSDDEIVNIHQKSLSQSSSKSINDSVPINLSPISICSSPELDKFKSQEILEAHSFKNDFEPKYSNFNKEIKNDHFNEIEFADDRDTNLVITQSRKFENSQNNNLLKNNSLINKSSKNENKSQNIDDKSCKKLEISSLICSPIINTANHLQTNCINPKSSKDLDLLNSPEISSLSKRKMKSKSKSDKKFENTKTDESNLLLQRSISFTTPKEVISSRLNTNFEDVTPPLDYSSLETPKLRKELNRFGLKPMPRQKAKIILSHIYNETHPTVSLSQKRVSSSEDEEPPLKRQNTCPSPEKRLTSKTSKSKSKLDFNKSSGIAEEMDFEDTEVSTNSKNKVNIKEAFNSLIDSDKILYNKILTYEPLPLEDLHLTLKTKGLKCNLKDLMNYLDEQCITFKVTTNNNGSRQKKKS